MARAQHLILPDGQTVLSRTGAQLYSAANATSSPESAASFKISA